MKQRQKSKSIVQKILEFNDWFISLIIILFIVLRLPSLFEPYWYGDEGIYETIGKALVHGRILYQGIWDNKPPLLYVLYAFFDGSQPWVRLVSLIVGLATVLVFYFLSRALLKNRIAQCVATLVFTLGFALPLLEGNIANAENFILLPIVTSWYIMHRNFPAKRSVMLFSFLGVLMSIAALTKIVAVFDLAAMGIFMVLVVTAEKKIVFARYLSGWFAMAVGFIAPIVATSLYFLLHQAFGAFFAGTFSQNISYVGVNNFFLFPLGLVVLKILCLLVALAVLWSIRKRLSVASLLIATWFVWGMFSAFFSERPYTHYLLMLLPSFSLMVALIWESKVRKSLVGVVLLSALILIGFNFPFYRKVGSYYLNYIQYILGSKSAENYERFFDYNTPRDYALAGYIKMHTTPQDSVFFWSDSGQLYALSGKLPPGKYIVAYHVTFYPDGFSNTLDALSRQKPRFIISTRDDLPALFVKNYTLQYHFSNARIYERTH